MIEKIDLPALALPALRAQMGDWVYYICFMKMRDIAERISIAKEIHTSKSLQTLLQRQLTNRSQDIATYLLSQDQRFFNSLVVGTYGGSPKWNELAIKSKLPDTEASSEYLDGSLGVLSLSGSEKLFAIDGQHRVGGIRQAVKEVPTLGNEEVAVIFVAGVTQEYRKDDPAGFERTRRLFTTLNRYAKPVSKKDIVALDEDDVVAIITRTLVEEYPLFQDRIALNQTKSIPVTDKQNLTTIITLYEVLNLYLRTGIPREWDKFKRFRPSDDRIKEYYYQSTEFWDAFIGAFPPLRELRDSQPTEQVAGKYRHSEGGHLLFRPLGLLLCTQVVKMFVESNVALFEAINRISRAPMEISREPWVGVLWDTINRRMMASKENQEAALKLLFNALGGNLSTMRTSAKALRRELAGILNKDEASVELPRYN